MLFPPFEGFLEALFYIGARGKSELSLSFGAIPGVIVGEDPDAEEAYKGRPLKGEKPVSYLKGEGKSPSYLDGHPDYRSSHKACQCPPEFPGFSQRSTKNVSLSESLFAGGGQHYPFYQIFNVNSVVIVLAVARKEAESCL